MPALWSGTLSFGLVSVPVEVIPAIRPHRSGFHLLHAKDNARLRRRMWCPNERTYVHPEHMLRAYAADSRQVVVSQSELAELAPRRSETIEILQFVDAAEIPPLYYDRPYYLLPTRNTHKPYRLLVEAMEQTGKVGVAKFVMHQREHLAAVRTVNGALCLLLMHFADEVLEADEVAPAAQDAPAAKREPIEQAVGKLAAHFDPKRYTDEYQQRIDRLIERKRRDQGTVQAPAAAGEEAPEGQEQAPPDLMTVLEESLARTAGKKGHK